MPKPLHRARLSALLLILPLPGCLSLGDLPFGGTQKPASSPEAPYAPLGRAEKGTAVDGLIVGHRLMEAGEYELALRAYYRAAAEDGVTVDTLSAIGSADLRLGRLGQAEEILRRAVATDDSFVPAWNNLGVVLMEKGEAAEASRVFRTAYALDSGESDVIRENLRRALAQMAQPEYYDREEPAEYKLVRRGYGEYVLLGAE